MQTTLGQDGQRFTLAAQTEADFAFIDAIEQHRSIRVLRMLGRSRVEGLSATTDATALSYTTTGAELEINSKSPQALEAQTARQFLRAVRELLRLGLGEDALHSHIGLDTANPQTQQQIAALFKQLQLVLQLGAIAVCEPEGVREKVDAAHGNTPCSEKAILAQGGAA